MAYCKKCGRMTDGSSELCENCRNEELIFGDETATATEVPIDDYKKKVGRMDGFGKALTSAILGNVANSILGSGLGLSSGSSDVTFLVISFVIALAPMIIAIVFGIKSIKTFVHNKRMGLAKPIATLILGIVGLASVVLEILLFFVLVIFITGGGVIQMPF